MRCLDGMLLDDAVLTLNLDVSSYTSSTQQYNAPLPITHYASSAVSTSIENEMY